jgi:hypothetical protein
MHRIPFTFFGGVVATFPFTAHLRAQETAEAKTQATAISVGGAGTQPAYVN